MMLKDLIRNTRSYRRFDGSVAVDEATLRELVDFARHSPSSANLQPLKYVLACDETTCGKIFPHLRWAGYLEDWKGPVAQKNSALDKCTYPWVLSLDCDEEVSPDLKKSLADAIRKNETEGYFVLRLSKYLGKWI